MPSNGSEDIPHVSVHDHYIRVPKTQKGDAEQMKKLVGLYAVNNPTPDKETEIRAYLEYWEKFDKNPFFINQANILLQEHNFPRLSLKYHYLKKNYKAAIGLELEAEDLSGWENFMLGSSYLKEKQVSLGIFHLEKAYKLNPTNRTIGSELLKWYANSADVEKGIRLGEDLVMEFPTSGMIHNNLSKSLIMGGYPAKALPYMKKALLLEPDELSVWSTYLNYYASKGDKKNFKKWLIKIQEKAPRYLDQAQIAAILDTLE